MKATARTVIDQPIEVVRASLADLEPMDTWVEGVSTVEPPTGPIGVGAELSSAYPYRGRPFDVEYEVTSSDPPHRLGIRSTTGPFPFSGSVQLTETEGGTAVAHTVDAGSDSRSTSVVFALLGPVLRRRMRRRLAAELEALAEAVAARDGVEAEPTPWPDRPAEPPSGLTPPTANATP